ncbi:(d)CMP kinase [Methylotenera sp.]|uniref:(d)CMP kinase n=1 Tax=Methylotenera sp. TaxID=2051956 RepID=UPI002732179B|nr:(d)CMP kinase [Methylotenera sp.]MDP2230624.1 (d)CMP kinase [Methylotenera sp.]MDP3140682.1 (d)CMP kinase [Methylotenera sp.]
MSNVIQNNIPVIAIDGPSASGKGTVAQLAASRLGFHYLDSGALYRIVAWATQQRNIAWDDAIAVTECAKTLIIEFINEQVFLNNTDISNEIRTEAIGKGASQVAVHAPLRAALLDMQHGFCRAPGLVADGRDMGTVVFPNAELKIFLTAKTETRAQRRYQQLLAKNQVSLDFSNTYDSILQDLLERDARDKNRASAPLTLADDAILLETDNLSISAAVDNVLYNFQQKISK